MWYHHKTNEKRLIGSKWGHFSTSQLSSECKCTLLLCWVYCSHTDQFHSWRKISSMPTEKQHPLTHTVKKKQAEGAVQAPITCTVHWWEYSGRSIKPLSVLSSAISLQEGYKGRSLLTLLGADLPAVYGTLHRTPQWWEDSWALSSLHRF